MQRTLEEDWSVVPWVRYDEDPPGPDTPSGAVATVDGIEFDLVPRLDPAWEKKHRREGAQIHDHARHISYRVTLSSPTGPIDHLEVVVSATVPDRSHVPLPIARIRRAAADFLAEQRRARFQNPNVFVMTPVGGVSNPDSKIPSAAEIARHLATEGHSRAWLAKEYGRPLSTVDRWIRNARQELPDQMPPVKQGKRNDRATKKEAK